jgi:hypothetical protein
MALAGKSVCPAAQQYTSLLSFGSLQRGLHLCASRWAVAKGAGVSGTLVTAGQPACCACPVSRYKWWCVTLGMLLKSVNYSQRGTFTTHQRANRCLNAKTTKTSLSAAVSLFCPSPPFRHHSSLRLTVKSSHTAATMALLAKQQIAVGKTVGARRSVARVVVCKASKANVEGEMVGNARDQWGSLRASRGHWTTAIAGQQGLCVSIGPFAGSFLTASCVAPFYVCAAPPCCPGHARWCRGPGLRRGSLSGRVR